MFAMSNVTWAKFSCYSDGRSFSLVAVFCIVLILELLGLNEGCCIVMFVDIQTNVMGYTLQCWYHISLGLIHSVTLTLVLCAMLLLAYSSR